MVAYFEKKSLNAFHDDVIDFIQRFLGIPVGRDVYTAGLRTMMCVRDTKIGSTRRTMRSWMPSEIRLHIRSW